MTFNFKLDVKLQPSVQNEKTDDLIFSPHWLCNIWFEFISSYRSM